MTSRYDQASPEVRALLDEHDDVQLAELFIAAKADLAAYAEADSADAAAGSYAMRAETAEARLRAAEFTAAHWSQATIGRDIVAAHALACVRAALKGQTRPEELGLDDGVHEAFRAALDGTGPEPPAWTPPPPGSPDAHIYLSTGCFHGDHGYCQNMTGLNGAKRPSRCKKCGAKCICRCHRAEAPAAPEEFEADPASNTAPKAAPKAEADELTAEEARDLVDELSTDLYQAQDALAFVAECCDIADREQRQPTTADVREWLKGARCGRQLAADARRTQAAVVDRQTAAVLAALHRSAEETVTRVIDLYETWVKAGPPPLGASIARWWDRRLTELRAAIQPADAPKG